MIRREFDPLTPQLQCYVKNAPVLCPWYHRHDGYEIFIFLDSEGVNFWVDQKCYPLTEGSMVIVNPNEFHRSEFLDPNPKRRIVINIAREFLDSIPDGQTSMTACFDNRRVGEGNLVQLSRNDRNEYLNLANRLHHALREDDSPTDTRFSRRLT